MKQGIPNVVQAPAVAETAAEREWQEPGGARIHVFSEGDALFEAMWSDIDAARERVWLESYIFEEDEIGRQFIARLLDCVARGVDVRVRVDALGSRFGLSGGTAHRLRNKGVRFLWCHPWQWRHPWTFHRRNHRKLLVVDDRATYLGGFNICATNSRRSHGDDRWRDTHIRMTGAVVAAAASAFAAFGAGQLNWHGDETQALYLLTNHARGCRYRLRCVLRQHLEEARERIWLTSPYFVPDAGTQGCLIAASQRGVDVRVLTPAKSDVRIVQWASRAVYSRLLRAGVRLFEYQPRTLHAKTLLVDDGWSTIGTANFDYRSFFINYELNLVAQSPRLNAALADLFKRDLSFSQEIRQRPWAARPAGDRLAEAIGWSARHWL